MTADELEGVSPSFINSLPKDGDHLILGCKSPQWVAVMESAKLAGTRKKMMELNYTK